MIRSRTHTAPAQHQRQIIYQNPANFLALFLLFSLTGAVAPLRIFSGNLIGEKPIQESRGNADEQEVRPIEAGKPARRELAGGQQHSYQIRLIADQFLKVAVEQYGIDVVVRVSGVDGKQIADLDSERRTSGKEIVSLVAKTAGEYRLDVRSRIKNVQAGSYELRVEELRDATENDRALQEARELFDKHLELERAGRYDEALPLIERVLAIREKILGKDHPDAGAAINSLGVLYRDKGEYERAESLYQRALAIREKGLGAEHPTVGASLNNLALLYRDKGDYAKAVPIFQRSIAIWEKAVGPEHPDVAIPIINFAVLCWDMGAFAKAEPLYQRALTIFENVLGPEHPYVAVTLDNLANLYRDKGDYEKAEPMRQRALDIRERALGQEHRDVALSLNNLAIIYRDKGDYEKAEPLYQRSLAIREKVLGPEHPDVAQSLSNLASLYRDKGDNEKAEPLHRRALAIREKTLGPDHPDVATSLNNIANLYWDKGDYARAESLYRRALDIREKSLGPEHPDVGSSLNDIAGLYNSRGEYAKAEPLVKRSLVILEKALGPEHPYIASSLNNLAILNAAKGDIAQAIALQSRGNILSERNLAFNLVTGSERQKLAYLATLSGQVDQTISLHLRYAPDNPAALNLAAAMILQRKGRALDATSENLNALRARFDSKDRVLLDELTDTRSQLARHVLAGPQRMTAEQYNGRLKKLEDRAEAYEADISHRSSEFRAQALPITIAAVQSAIPADVALIEFASYRPINAKSSRNEEAYGQPCYVAYILRQHGKIQWKELGEVKIIDEAITALRDALRDPKRSDVKRRARAVDQKVFQPLRPLLGKITQLLISPDGNLNLVPFVALLDERGRYAIERYSISYLASGRDLLRLQVDRESRNGPLVVANPAFGKRAKVDAGRRSQPSKKDESAASAFREFYFSPLPYTAQEGDVLRELMPGSILLTGEQATKTELSQISSPALLHIATHGFFLEDSQMLSAGGGRGYQESSDDPDRMIRQMERSGISIENPLLRSGLALAGANEHKQEDNGILTALEVTGLNLWGTKLVVLSACDTGIGDVKNGDGVHGLRRALVLAGAETQVMSLWAVSDKGTRELMISYYHLLQQGEGRGEALRQVQLEMLKKANRQHPYYWASFIQSGEWANLDGKRTREKMN